MYRMHRIFCATPWELEGERRAFYDVLGEFNEAEAMKRGVLYVPVSLLNVRDKRPLQYAVDENIRDCRHYILALCDGWGPPERNFERDYRLALECSADPSLPMREIALLLQKPLPGHSSPSGLPAARAEFSTIDEFKQQVRRLFAEWIETAAQGFALSDGAGA